MKVPLEELLSLCLAEFEATDSSSTKKKKKFQEQLVGG